MSSNTLYFGDNLDVLRERLADESVDLIYLDPPFNSNRNYNVMFKEEGGGESRSQIVAFEDTWRWDISARDTYADLLLKAPPKLRKVIEALYTMLGSSSMMAYIVMMTARLIELHRVLKPTGSLFLHCDPTASHYLRIILDSVFGPTNFKNNIIWKRTGAKSNATRRLPTNQDHILFYQKSDDAAWNMDKVFLDYDEDNLDAKTKEAYKHIDEDGRRYQLDNLVNPARKRPNLTYEFLGITRVWRWTRERMQKAYDDGLVVQTNPGTVPRFKRYLDQQQGVSTGDVWTDVPPLGSRAKERTGYPTQKPVALLERIIALASNPGDIVLDPFAGCGTTIVAAEDLKRRWIGIDITYLGINMLSYRLGENFGLKTGVDYKVVGLPRALEDARALAINSENDGRYQFQFWALSLVAARSERGAEKHSVKKGTDAGIDGVISFIEQEKRQLISRQVIVEVKSGKVGVAMIRSLRGAVEREKAAIGVLITLEEPSAPMRKEALDAGTYTSPTWGKSYPRLQILTIAELLDGAQVDMPPQLPPYKGGGNGGNGGSGGITQALLM